MGKKKKEKGKLLFLVDWLVGRLIRENSTKHFVPRFLFVVRVRPETFCLFLLLFTLMYFFAFSVPEPLLLCVVLLLLLSSALPLSP